MNEDNKWHHSKVPFFLEVEYYDEYNPETESILMKSLLEGDEILPGLRVNKMFANFVDKDILVADEIHKDLHHLKEEFEKFSIKYANFMDDKSKDNCMNKLGMNPKDFSDKEKKHAEEIKQVTSNGQTPKINSETGRYIAYDDLSNFPT